ncbi:hypothetical protein DSM104299_03236 [Baekduia alba]|uniref:hypothetical protein n=1 Tax=Baekduia alba TaxID=2997333 RepID=UPI002340F6FA|nr:hypothetical protein [Baekduia alba]WCB94499.1 hypothetical protein DSM104299_03236 [Baekduia alba]
MASHVLRSDRFPVGTSVGIYPVAQKNPGVAPQGSAVQTASVAADGTLTFVGLPDGTAYTAYATVNSVVVYVDFRTDNARIPEKGRESREQPSLPELKRRLWLPGAAVDDTIPRSDATSATAQALTSGTLHLAGGVVLPAGAQVTRVGFVSGSTAGATLTNQWFAIVRQADLAVLAVTVDDGATAWAANTLKELLLSAPLQLLDDTPVYLGCLVAATTPPNLGGAPLANAVIAGLGGTAKLSGTSSTGLTAPVAVGSAAGAVTATGGVPYAFVR